MRDTWSRLAALEQVMSDYRPDSELSRLNRRAGEGPVPLSGELRSVLERAAAIAAETGGTFDVTVGPLVDQWRAARRSGRLAPEPERRSARALVGPELLRLDPEAGTATLVRAGMRLDLGGIGKGVAADAAVRSLREAGFPACLVSIAGDVAAGDPPPAREAASGGRDGSRGAGLGAADRADRGWRVIAGRDGEAAPARLRLAGAAVSTSGDSSQFIDIGGTRYAHIVDPRTGLGATVRRAVTVLAPSAADADALASAFHLLGPAASAPIVAGRPGTAARFHEPATAGAPARTVIIDPHGAWHAATAGLAVTPPHSRAAARVRPDPVLGVPVVDLDRPEHAGRFVVVDREAGQYLGHPTTVRLGDAETILCVYPQGHGRGSIILKRSVDGGRTWSPRLPVPGNWATSRETPTIHRVADPAGGHRLILFSGLHPVRMAASEDEGDTWTPLAPVGDWGGIVTMSTVEPVRAPGGGERLMALFHDDGRFFAEGGRAAGTFTLYRTWSTDGGRTWTTPEAIWSGSELHLCEPGFVRSPDGRTIAMLLRENRRRSTSHVMTSTDEGVSWSAPRRLPLALTGDRHQARFAPDGRLLVSFRDMAMGSPTHGDWVAWVGTFEDLIDGAGGGDGDVGDVGPGPYRVRLQDNLGGSDCAYPGVEVLADGTFVLTTYGHWAAGESPFILSVRVTLADLDAALAAGHGVVGPAPGLPGAATP